MLNTAIHRPGMPTEAEIIALQAYAIKHSLAGLKLTCWTALGFSQRHAFEPVTVAERDRALLLVAGELEMCRQTGVVL